MDVGLRCRRGGRVNSVVVLSILSTVGYAGAVPVYAGHKCLNRRH